MAKIQIISDLHLEAKYPSGRTETLYESFELKPTAPYLALLGNIGKVKDKAYFHFLRRMLKQYQIVFYVPGNREPYGSNWPATTARLTEFAVDTDRQLAKMRPGSKMGKFVLMDKRRFDLNDDLTILGCTLFSTIEPQYQADVKEHVDFQCIGHWTVEQHNSYHMQDARWLNAEVRNLAANWPERKIIILTHYCPSYQATKLKYKDVNDTARVPDTTDMTRAICWTNPNVVAWAFGHTGYNCDIVDNETQNKKRVITNQRGHFRTLVEEFDPDKTLDVELVTVGKPKSGNWTWWPW
ncbi:hypothetical protein TWF696_001926 [Orbilia brochopaga]|uniref:Calcineurin-like phosphoesterase domain-containing protein n=1 Tax=Orbilia brochopaga TaxID=3140254 RepID=A0AAV9U6T0_9PEZI